MRDRMIALRETQGKTQRDMAIACDISLKLIRDLEETDTTTVWQIADRVAAIYGMTLDERNDLCLPKDHRQPGEPKKRKLERRKGRWFVRVNSALIHERIKALGLTVQGASVMAGKGKSWLHYRAKAQYVAVEDMPALAAALGVTMEVLEVRS